MHAKSQIRKADKKTCVGDKGNSKFEPGEELERNDGRDDDDFHEYEQ